MGYFSEIEELQADYERDDLGASDKGFIDYLLDDKIINAQQHTILSLWIRLDQVDSRVFDALKEKHWDEYIEVLEDSKNNERDQQTTLRR